MKTCYALLLSCLFLATSASAANWNKQLFQHLRQHPAFTTATYQDQALILQDDKENFYAAFALVQSEASPLLCAYAAPFDALIGQKPGAYTFKPVYLCDSAQRLAVYTGHFHLKNPPCPREVCAHPAIGVGNLIVRPAQPMNLNRLPAELSVEIDGEIVPPSVEAY